MLILQAKQIYMQKIKQYISSRKYVLILVFLFFLIRLPFLDSTFLLYDERDMALSQYSLAKTGQDLYGNRLPLQFAHISPHAPILAMYYGVPFWSMNLPLNTSTVRLIYLLPATLIPLLVFELLFALTKRKNISLLTSLIFSFSPWLFHISKLALEINIAFPLFLIALILQIKKRLPLSFIFYSLTFFTYQGMRPLIPIVFIYFEIFSLLQKKKLIIFLKNVVIFIILFFLLFRVSTLLEDNFVSRSSSEIVFFAGQQLKSEVDQNRSVGKSIPIISNIIYNKVVLVSDYLIGNIFRGLDLSYYFKTGDQTPIYSNGVIGQFFPIFSVFLILGILKMGNIKLKEYFFIAGISIIGLVSSVINIYSVSFSIRSLFSGVGISFIIAIGLIWSYQFILKQSKIIKYLFLFLFAIILCFQVGSFLYRYSFQRPILQSELFNENERKLSQYLLKERGPYTIDLSSPFADFLSYIFLHQPETNELKTIQNILKKSQTSFLFENKLFELCNKGDIDFILPPKKKIIDATCLSEKTRALYKTLKTTSYETIQFSDSDPLRPTNEVKFYIFK